MTRVMLDTSAYSIFMRGHPEVKLSLQRAGFMRGKHRKKKNSGTPIPTNDIWIAASAMQHGLRVLTADVYYQSVPRRITEAKPREKRL